MDEQKIIDYYDQCEIDYRINWRLDRSMALHYGYWDWSTWTFGQALKKTNDVLIKRAHIKPGERVLDAGCGVGGSSIHLARFPGCEVMGVSLCENQVRSARRNAKKKGVSDRVSFHCLNYMETGFEDSSFDVVWAIESSCYADDREAYFREMNRLLKPGGRLIIADFFRRPGDFSSKEEALMHRWEES